MKRGELALVLFLCAVILSGCNMYWTKPNATLAKFTEDHRACLAKGESIPDKPGYVIIDQNTFRTCMAVRGWHRVKHDVNHVPPGCYRGVEDFDRLQPIAVDVLPKQPDSAQIDMSDPRYFIQPAR